MTQMAPFSIREVYCYGRRSDVVRVRNVTSKGGEEEEAGEESSGRYLIVSFVPRRPLPARAAAAARKGRASPAATCPTGQLRDAAAFVSCKCQARANKRGLSSPQ